MKNYGTIQLTPGTFLRYSISEGTEKIYVHEKKGLTKKNVPATTCLVTVDFPDNTVDVTMETVRKYHRDPFDREKAKKYLMEKAINNLALPKEDRYIFWTKFLGTQINGNNSR